MDKVRKRNTPTKVGDLKTTFWNSILLCVTKVIVNKGHVTVMLEINTYVDEQFFWTQIKKNTNVISSVCLQDHFCEVYI